MADRFRVVMVKDARAQGLPGVSLWDFDYANFLYDFSTSPPTLIASDRMEPEDVTFHRDLAWAPKLLNELASAITKESA